MFARQGSHGGIFVKAVNADFANGSHHGKTRCADGTWQNDCYVGAIEYSTFGHNGRLQATFDTRFKAARLIRGALAATKLVARKRGTARRDEAPTGSFASVTIRTCVPQPFVPHAFRDS